MDTKIGILTFHDAYNYGAVLQNYALLTALEKIHPNKEIVTVDYRCRAVIPNSTLKDMKKSKGLFNALLHYPGRRLVSNVYRNFRHRYLKLSREYNTHEELLNDLNEYSALVSGSDQVWNKKFNGSDGIYTQDFHNVNIKKYSYAVSLGTEYFPEDDVAYYKETLSQFNVISMREITGQNAVETQLGLKAEQHIDPTFLLLKEEWDKIATAPKYQKFILVYMVPYQKSVVDFAQKCGKELSLPIIVITKSLKPYFLKHKDASTPNDFLGLVRDAELVITNSFHGTAFSIIYKKKFALDLYNSRGFNYRCANLLSVCGIDYDEKFKGMQLMECNDWSVVEDRINIERNNAYSYLATIGNNF